MLHLVANAPVSAPEDLGIRHGLVGGVRILAELVMPDDDHRVSGVIAAVAWRVRIGRQQVFGRFETDDNS